VLLIRHSFDQNSAEAAKSIAPPVPKSVSAQRGLSYAPGDRDALFDVFEPANAQAHLPAVVRVHGGGFVASSRSDMSGYLQVLAARGYMTIAIWAYLGTHDPRVRELPVTPHVTAAYPPVFISVGNADPLAPQSVAFAETLRAKGVEVDALFHQ